MDVTQERPVRVVVADDHLPYRGGICAALDGHGFEVCAEAANGPAAVRATLEHGPEVVLMDISMPGGDGIIATAEITSQLPETKVVMLTAFYDDDNLFGAIKAGASGYLFKGEVGQDLPHRLRKVLQGKPLSHPDS
jgi:DNA-binding NarL/FixJ family response regulator